MERHSVLIVNSNIGSRAILREALKSFLYKSKILQTQSLKDAAELLKHGDQVDVIFVSFDFGQPLIAEFISVLKNEPSITAPPIITTLQSRDNDTSSGVTSLYLEGVAGFISEPYSSDDIAKLWRTVIESKKNPEPTNKISKATYLLLNEAIRYVDTYKNPKSVRNLKKMSVKLGELYAQDTEQYVEALVRAFEKVKPPKNSESTRKTKAALKVLEHPGKLIAELMERRMLTFEGLQNSLKIESFQFEKIVRGEVGIDEVSSREIARIFGRTSKEWLAMQESYDAYITQTTKSEPEK